MQTAGMTSYSVTVLQPTGRPLRARELSVVMAAAAAAVITPTTTTTRLKADLAQVQVAFHQARPAMPVKEEAPLFTMLELQITLAQMVVQLIRVQPP